MASNYIPAWDEDQAKKGETMPQVYRSRRHALIPSDPPTHQAVMDACAVLGQQQLAVYQRLYAVGLTSPGHPAAPFEVQRSRARFACIEVSLHQQYSIPPYYTFVLEPYETLEHVVPKCKLIIEAVEADRQLVHARACCPLATLRPCMCTVSFTCELHGVHCHGTHD